MIASDLTGSTAHELSRALGEGKTSSEAITKAFLWMQRTCLLKPNGPMTADLKDSQRDRWMEFPLG